VLKSGMMKPPCWLPTLSVRCSTPEPPTPVVHSKYAEPLMNVSGGWRQSSKLYVLMGLPTVIGATTVSSALLLVAEPLGPVPVTLNRAPLSPNTVGGVVYEELVAPLMATL